MRGTWQPPLFSDQAWSDDMKEKLTESGFVTVTCQIIDDKIDSQQTSITLTYNDEILLQKNGEEALHHLYDTYLLP